jgi:hypothetical protein
MVTRRRISSTLIVCAVLTLTAPQASAQALIPCAPDSVEFATRTLDGLRDVATGQTSGDSVWRASVGVEQTDSSLVTMVHDPAVCDAAARAWAHLISPTASPDAVWVIAFGPDRYFIFDERRPTVGALLIGVFDRSLVWLKDVLM